MRLPARVLLCASAALALAASCASDERVRFSDRPVLREEEVLGCGGGGLRYLVPARAEPVLRETATRELVDEEAEWTIESDRVACEFCDANGGVCGFVTVRYPGRTDGRAGLRLRYRSTVAKAERSWTLLDSNRLVDEARLDGSLSYEAAADVLDWTRAHVELDGPLDSVAAADAIHEDTAPDGARFRVTQVRRVLHGGVLRRRIYLKRDKGGFELLHIHEQRDDVD
jgi:hypothetical protein